MKQKLIIHPREGINAVRLGMSRKEIHSEFGMPDDSFLKFPDDQNESEEYKKLALFVYYDQNDRAKSIEAWDEALLFYNDIDLFNLKYKSAVRVFKELDPALEVSSDSLISRKLGIHFWYEDEIADDSRPSSVTVFK